MLKSARYLFRPNKRHNKFEFILGLSLGLIFILGSVPLTHATENYSKRKEGLPGGHLVYSELDFEIRVTSIRAGNQDESGINKYFFKLTYIGHASKKTDSSKKNKSKPVILEGDTFGKIKVKSLDIWRENPKANDTAVIDISGDSLRIFVSSIMKSLKSEESDVSVEIEISQFEDNKKFGFFGDNQKIGSVKFSPIPKKGSFTQVRTNLELDIRGDKSTHVTIQVNYKNPIKSNQSSDSAKSR